MQDEEQVEGPSRHKTETATRSMEEASSTETAEATCEGEHATPSQSETCTVGGGDGGARLTVAEGVVLREGCVRDTTSKYGDDGEARELPPDTWKERDGA